MRLASEAFQDGQPIPAKHTEDGADVSPPLSWSGAPDGVVEFALICDDPDAPREEPWVHWVLFKIPGDARGLPESLPRENELAKIGGARQGRNSFPANNLEHRGPTPPPGHGTHHYHFKLYALDAPIDLPPGAPKNALLDAMEGLILAHAELIGTYER